MGTGPRRRRACRAPCCHSSKTRTPPESDSRGGVPGTLTGFKVRDSTGGNTFAQVIIPHGTSGTKSPYGMEVPDHGRLTSGDRDGQRLALGCPELDDVRTIVLWPVDHDPALARHRRFFLPHSSSSSRLTAGAAEFFILSQSGERPERYGESFRFETMPSRPSLQA